MINNRSPGRWIPGDFLLPVHHEAAEPGGAFSSRRRCLSAHTGADEVSAVGTQIFRALYCGRLTTSSVSRLAGDAVCHLPLKGEGFGAGRLLRIPGEEKSIRAGKTVIEYFRDLYK